MPDVLHASYADGLIGWVNSIIRPDSGFSSIGYKGSPVTRLNTNSKPCLVPWATASDPPAFMCHGQQHRRAQQVLVEQIVMHDLVMPEPFSSSRIQGQQAIGKKIHPVTAAAKKFGSAVLVAT